MQLPEGASVNRTEAVVKRVEEIARNTPGVASVTSVVGFSLIDNLTKSNSALIGMRASGSSMFTAASSGRAPAPPAPRGW